MSVMEIEAYRGKEFMGIARRDGSRPLR